MTDLILLLVAAILINNIVLVQFLGLCPFLGVSNQLDTAIGMSFATTFVLTLSSGLSALVYQYILLPLEVAYLRTIAFIVVIAVVVQATEMIMRATSPLMYRILGIFLPLITTNCAVLGVALLNLQLGHGFMHSLWYGFGVAVGFSIVLILFATLRERLALADIPSPFRGPAIGMISAGLMALAFMGFSGMVIR